MAYSYDGWHFQRGPREPFVANADPGRIGAGCILPCSLVATESEIRLYCCASAQEHAVFGEESPQRSAILMHRLRPDGFVCLEAASGQGRLKTRALLVQGDGLSFNVQAPGGQFLVGVSDADGKPIPGYGLEDCSPCSTDSTAWVPRWKDGARFDSLKGRAVQLELQLSGGRLYAVSGDFQMLSAKEGMRYMRFGTPPRPQRLGALMGFRFSLSQAGWRDRSGAKQAVPTGPNRSHGPLCQDRPRPARPPLRHLSGEQP